MKKKTRNKISVALKKYYHKKQLIKEKRIRGIKIYWRDVFEARAELQVNTAEARKVIKGLKHKERLEKIKEEKKKRVEVEWLEFYFKDIKYVDYIEYERGKTWEIPDDFKQRVIKMLEKCKTDKGYYFTVYVKQKDIIAQSKDNLFINTETSYFSSDRIFYIIVNMMYRLKDEYHFVSNIKSYLKISCL
jgi:hypothetical protein